MKYYASINYSWDRTNEEAVSLGRLEFDALTGTVTVEKKFSEAAIILYARGLLPHADEYFDATANRLTTAQWSKAELDQFIDTRANAIRLTQLKSFR